MEEEEPWAAALYGVMDYLDRHHWGVRCTQCRRHDIWRGVYALVRNADGEIVSSLSMKNHLWEEQVTTVAEALKWMDTACCLPCRRCVTDDAWAKSTTLPKSLTGRK